MNLLKFIQEFPDESACRLKFKQERDKIGITCKRCNCQDHYWLENKSSYECKKCHSRTSLRSGTVLQNTKLPYRYWLIAIHLLTSTKKSFSTEELRLQLGHKRYQPIWEMVCKLRDVMGKRDDQYDLSGQIELDDAFFTTEIPDSQKGEPLKRGRGSQNKTKVLVMCESRFEDTPRKGQRPKRVGYLKMKVISDLKADTITPIVKEQVDENSELLTDDSTSYVDLKQHVQSHISKAIEPEELETVLPWVHVAIANAKRLLLDIHHKLKTEYLQYYLNEFCYKFNRRFFREKQFDRLVFAAVSYQSDFRTKIYNRTLCG
ncbi:MULTISPECIES: IS1595 family transposase [unclassified Proteiniphilum]|jgi:transposase-like protein|uniref:IS1595 family transposase n=1 Tax=unclassified Proteiniphilum TaxID=2622718 RepID=UPI00257C94CF|nr:MULTISPECIES: IS1595 family transposase [unclassified Proteiniphilum]